MIMMADALVDANYLIALAYPKDNNHLPASAFARTTEDTLLVPTIILPEVVYILKRVGGIPAAVRFGEQLMAEKTPLITTTAPDLTRAFALMQRYRKAELDFVDSCLTALAERLQITRICTFDRRDFSIIRPAHADYFELLP